MLVLKQIRGGSIFVGRNQKVTVVSVDPRTGNVELGFDVAPAIQVSRSDHGYVAHMRAQIRRDWQQIEHAFDGQPGRSCALCGLRHEGGRDAANR